MANLGKLAANFAGAVKRVTVAAVKGEDILADKLTKEGRRAICRLCDHSSGSRCDECGCFIKEKTSLLTEKCPFDFW